MAWPVYISSTWPLSSPMCFHCSAKYFWERGAMILVMRKLRGSTTRVIAVSRGLMVSIMTMTPRMVTTEVITCPRLCWRVPAMLSMSLVNRLMISPCVRPSK